jgi:voltage-dependent calcium channel L type alpha-1D
MIFITVCILLNTGFLAADRYPITTENEKVIEYANLTFYSIFVAEMALKLYAHGIGGYCQERFNVFDGIIVILSTVEVIMTYTGAGAGVSSGGAISAFRAFRLLRLFKLAKSWQQLQDLLQKIARTLGQVSYFAILVFLFIFIYSLLGMELFAHNIKLDENDEVDSKYGTSPRENFDDFFHAFVSIYVVLVGDDW